MRQLTSANLNQSSLAGAALSNASFRGTFLDGVEWRDVTLDHADFTGARVDAEALRRNAKLRELEWGLSEDAAAKRAERVTSTMARHGMKRASERVEEQGQTLFRSVEWPAPPWADADGFHEVVVLHTSGPGTCEADGTTLADRIASNSPRMELLYDFGSQGGYQHLEPIVVSQSQVVTVEGQTFEGGLPFNPDRGEAVVLHNGKHALRRVRCLGEARGDAERAQGFVEVPRGNRDLGDWLIRAVRSGEAVDGKDFSAPLSEDRTWRGSGLSVQSSSRQTSVALT